VFYGSSLFVDRSQIHNPNKAKKYEIKRVIKFEFEQFHSKEGAERSTHGIRGSSFIQDHTPV
jgi:hypothetical protein